jgi:hypothetical protein
MAAFRHTWVSIGKRTARQLARKASLVKLVDYESKPISVVICKGSSSKLSCGLLIHKRGGASKLLIYSKTSHGPTFNKFIAEIERIAEQFKRKKLYCLHQWNDLFVIEQLKKHGYQSEGVLKEPYAKGRDLLVLSKFIIDKQTAP